MEQSEISKESKGGYEIIEVRKKFTVAVEHKDGLESEGSSITFDDVIRDLYGFIRRFRS
jgi:hypothetical protein